MYACRPAHSPPAALLSKALISSEEGAALARSLGLKRRFDAGTSDAAAIDRLPHDGVKLTERLERAGPATPMAWACEEMTATRTAARRREREGLQLLEQGRRGLLDRIVGGCCRG